MMHAPQAKWPPDASGTIPTEYRNAVSTAIRDYLNTRSPVSLSELLLACRGAYPTVVLGSVSMLDSARWTKVTGLATSTQGSHESRLGDLPGNPVLSSWYFTATTCQKIAQLREWSGQRLAFLGTPRLYEWFAERRLGRVRLLLEMDGAALRALTELARDAGDRQLKYDARHELPASYAEAFDCVFFDPPWYPEHYAIWLRRACQLAPRGLLFFPLFPSLTRPSAPAEREAILRPLVDAGISVWMLSAFAEYVLPSFERAELLAGGIDVDCWKAADLVIADSARLSGLPATAPLDVDETPWTEVDLGSIRFFVDVSRAVPDRRLAFLPEGWTRILSSPSRRDPQRAQANVLSSGGHGFMTSDPTRLVTVLEEVARFSGPKEEALRAVAIDEDSKMLLESVFSES